MAKLNTIKKTYEFKRVYKKGKYQVSRNLTLYYLKNREDATRLGITISKKYGNSVTRNRVRRLIKENYRNLMIRIENDYDLVFVARKTGKLPSYRDIERDIEYILKKTGILISESK